MICRSLASRPPHGASNQSAYRLYERYGFNEVAGAATITRRRAGAKMPW